MALKRKFQPVVSSGPFVATQVQGLLKASQQCEAFFYVGQRLWSAQRDKTASQQCARRSVEVLKWRLRGKVKFGLVVDIPCANSKVKIRPKPDIGCAGLDAWKLPLDQPTIEIMKRFGR